MAAAREAAAACVAACALSLDAYTKDADYTHAAAAAMPLIRRLLYRVRAGSADALLGSVVNVNVPNQPLAALRGYAYTRQSYECTLPSFTEVAAPDAPQPLHALATGPPRAWKNGDTYVARLDREAGTDAAAVAAGFVAVSLVRLLSDAAPVGGPTPPAAAAPPLPPSLDVAALSDAAADYVLDVAAAAAQACAGATPATKLRKAPPLAAPAETSAL